MKQTPFLLLITSYFMWLACHNIEVLPPEEKPLTCEDTISIYHPGKMEHGFIKAVNTCLDWKAAGEVRDFNTSSNRMTISGTTYYAYPATQGDTSFYPAENLSFRTPKKIGKFPLVSSSQLFQDEADCKFSKIDIDVKTAEWSVYHSTSDNNIEITEIDTFNKRVKGRFNVHLKKEYPLSGTVHYPSKLYFHHGEFDVEIIN